MQLIQYAPTTETVCKRPLLYVPPLVNKYYLLDLQPKSSLIRWLVEQGHTLFVISWVNPGPELADKGLDDYLDARPRRRARRDREGDRRERGRPVRLLHGRHARRHGRGPRRSRAAIASLTTIGSMFDFANMGQWATFTRARRSSRRWRSISRPRA